MDDVTLLDSNVESANETPIIRSGDDQFVNLLLSDDIGYILKSIAEQIRQMIGAHQSAVSYIPDGIFRRAIHAHSFSKKYEAYSGYDVAPTGCGIWSLIFKYGKSIRLTEDELYSHPGFKHFSNMKTKSGLEHPPMPGWLAVPVKMREGGVTGVLQLSDRYEGEFTLEDQARLERLAVLVSATFEIEYKKEELALMNATLQEYSHIVNQSTDMMALIDKHYVYKLANEQYLKAFKVSEDQVVGNTIAAILGQSFFNEVIKPYADQCIAGEIVTYQDWFDFPGYSSSKFIEVHYTPYLSDSKNIEGFIVNARDISRYKRANEQVSQLNKELETFSYCVSHDLKAPLRHIVGYLDLFQKSIEQELTDSNLKYINIIKESAKRMSDLIESLLDFSNKGKQEIKLSKVSLSELLDKILCEFEIDMVDRDVTIEKDELPVVCADEDMMYYVLSNLINNALKFTRNEAKAIIKISCQKKDTIVKISISDNGVGFKSKYADKLFTIFRRLHSTSEFEGTGLGLANVARIIHRHHGEVSAKGELGKGATISFTIPLAQ